MTQCSECGSSFTPRAGGKPQRFCSGSCRREATERARADRRREERQKQFECVECGCAFFQASYGRPARFCSLQCKAKAGNRRLRRRARAPRSPETRQCARCGVEFKTLESERMYCSHNCNVAAYKKRKAADERVVAAERFCGNCGRRFVPNAHNQKWCSVACGNTARSKRYTRRRLARSGDTYTDREVFERDGWRCHLCNKRVNRTAKWPDPMAPTIDHLVPLSLGGEDSMANVATAHWKCNHAKRANVAGEQLHLT